MTDPTNIYDWRRVGLIDILAEALGDVSGVSVEQCRKDYAALSTEALESTFVEGFGVDIEAADRMIGL